MPVLDLLVRPPDVRGLPASGNLDLAPSVPGLSRILLRRLCCWLRSPPTPGALLSVLDTGATLTIFPHKVWHTHFGWRAGRDYDELTVPGVALRGQAGGHSYAFRFARLRVPVVLAGRDPRGDRLHLDGLVCQLADPGGLPFVLLGLWGGVFDNRKLVMERPPGSDDLTASLHF